MSNAVRTLEFTLAVFALLLTLDISSGQEKQAPRGVRDEAKLFSAEFIEKANAIAAEIKEKHGKDLLIETDNEMPENVKDRSPWAKARFKKAGGDGVYFVIANKPKTSEVVVGIKTLEAGLFELKNVDELLTIVRLNLKDSRDATLIKVANYTLETMNSHAKANLSGTWIGPPIEVAVKEDKNARLKAGTAKGHVHLKFFMIGKHRSVELGYRAVLEEGGFIANSSNRLAELNGANKRAIVIPHFDADGDLNLTYDMTGDGLKISTTRKVTLPDVASPVDLNGEWKRSSK